MAGSANFNGDQAVILLLGLGFTLEEAKDLVVKAADRGLATATIKVLSVSVEISRVQLRDDLYWITWGTTDENGVLQ